MERRTYERLPIHVDCVVIDKDSNKEYKGTLCDISEGGMGIILETDDVPKINTCCSIQFIDTFDKHTFVISEFIRISNIVKSSTHTRLGGVFYKTISKQCISYIRVISATLFENGSHYVAKTG